MSTERNPKKWRAYDFFLPTAAVRRSFQAISKTATVLKSSAAELKASLPDQAKPGQFEEGDVRNISDSKDRFVAMYELHAWTEKELLQQAKVLKRTKITAICVSVVSLVGIVAIAISVPVWLAIILIPASGSLLILGFAQAFKYALYESQIELRDFISAREFVGRDDFWQRFIG